MPRDDSIACFLGFGHFSSSLTQPCSLLQQSLLVAHVLQFAPWWLLGTSADSRWSCRCFQRKAFSLCRSLRAVWSAEHWPIYWRCLLHTCDSRFALRHRCVLFWFTRGFTIFDDFRCTQIQSGVIFGSSWALGRSKLFLIVWGWLEQGWISDWCYWLRRLRSDFLRGLKIELFVIRLRFLLWASRCSRGCFVRWVSRNGIWGVCTCTNFALNLSNLTFVGDYFIHSCWRWCLLWFSLITVLFGHGFRWTGLRSCFHFRLLSIIWCHWH